MEDLSFQFGAGEGILRPLRTAVAVALCGLVAAAQDRKPDLQIYGDALASGWILNGSGTASNSTSNVAPVHGGAMSMALSFSGAYGPCNFSNLSTTNYRALSLWVHGGSNGVQVGLQPVVGAAAQQTISLSAFPSNAWTNLVIPLEDMGCADIPNFTGFRLTDSSQRRFYVDDIVLIGKTLYSITYRGNGNSGGTQPVDPASPYVAGSAATLLGAGTLEKAGEVFISWNTASNGNGVAYAPGRVFTPATNLVLYAQWAASNAMHTVTYYANGAERGAVPVDMASPYRSASLVPVQQNTGGLWRRGFNFAGWNMASDGSATVYVPGETFAIGTATALYAQWTDIHAPVPYPYAPYNGGKMDPQLTGWPLTEAETNYLKKSEVDRYPGKEPGAAGVQIWDMIPVTPNTQGGGSDEINWYIGTCQPLINPLLAFKASNTPVDIIMVGDSITSQWGGGQSNGGVWQPYWTDYYGAYPSLNLGVGGDRTSTVLWRLDHTPFEELVASPLVCVLQIGNNNGYYNIQGVPTSANVQGVIWCLRNLRLKFPSTPIIWVNLFPTTDPSFSQRLKDMRDSLNTAGITTAGSTNFVADVYPLDLWDKYATATNAVVANPAYFYDGVHPNDAGYRLWATNMLPLVKTLMDRTILTNAFVWEGVASTNWGSRIAWIGSEAPANNAYQSGARFTSASARDPVLTENRSVCSVAFERSVTVNSDATVRTLTLTNGGTRLSIAPSCVVTMSVSVASTGGTGILGAGSRLAFRQDVPPGGIYTLGDGARLEYLGSNMSQFNYHTYYKGTGEMLFNGTLASDFRVHLQESAALTFGPNASVTTGGNYNFIGAYGTNTITLQKNFDLRASNLTGSLNVGVDTQLKNRTAKTTLQTGAYALAVNSVRFCGLDDGGGIKGVNPQLIMDGGLLQVGGSSATAIKGLLLTEHGGTLNYTSGSFTGKDGITVTLGSTGNGGVIRVDAWSTFSHVMSGNRNPGALLLLTNTVTLVNNGVFTNINSKSTVSLPGLVVAADATLGGAGTFAMGDYGTTNNAKYAFISGHIAPGETNALGTLTVTCKSLTWNGVSVPSSSWRWDLGAGNTSDKLLVRGDFNKGAGSTFVFDLQGRETLGRYELVEWTGATTFAAGDFSVANGRGSFAISDNKLILTVAPRGTRLMLR